MMKMKFKMDKIQSLIFVTLTQMMMMEIFCYDSTSADIIIPTTSTVISSTVSLLQTTDHPPVFALDGPYTGSVVEHSSDNYVVQGINLIVIDPDNRQR